MANILVDNPKECWKEKKHDGYETCRACYYSNVHNGQWCGPQKCYNAGCLKYGGQKA